jgi:hypothetical protein
MEHSSQPRIDLCPWIDNRRPPGPIDPRTSPARVPAWAWGRPSVSSENLIFGFVRESNFERERLKPKEKVP